MKCEACGVEDLTTVTSTTFPGGAKIYGCGACSKLLQATRNRVESEIKIPA